MDFMPRPAWRMGESPHPHVLERLQIGRVGIEVDFSLLLYALVACLNELLSGGGAQR